MNKQSSGEEAGDVYLATEQPKQSLPLKQPVPSKLRAALEKHFNTYTGLLQPLEPSVSQADGYSGIGDDL